MATRKLTDKQKDKLKNSKFVRSNSDDKTVNPSFEDDLEYDEDDGTLTYDKRTKNGKKIEKILNSRNRKSSTSQIEAKSNDDEENTWEDTEYNDDEFETYEENDDIELPEVCSCYRGWSIWVEKDDDHKYIVTAVLRNEDGDEIDKVEIKGDEIDKNESAEDAIINEINENERINAEFQDYRKHYFDYMNFPSNWKPEN